jgi:acetyl-CoA C-acetyltransferase
MREVLIIEAVRTAVGRRNGMLAHTHPIDLLATVQREVVERSGIDASEVGQVVGGCVDQVGAQCGNITRTAWLSAGLPLDAGCFTLDSACGSSQQSLGVAFGLVASGVEDAVVACGVENMSMVPIGANAADGAAAGHGKPINRTYREHYEYTTQFEGAERIAGKYGLTRQDADAFGLESQRRAARAVADGVFDREIVPVSAVAVDERGTRLADPVRFASDETPRRTTPEGLAGLKPVGRPDGVHTAGSSSQIADGASAVLVVAADRARELGLRGRARILQTCLVGCDPVLMLEGPIPATHRLLDRSGLGIDDVDVVEINEAFASVVLAWERELKPDMARVNPNGGAIALGHPLGATGCLLTTKALHELERADGQIGLITMCCGGGMGTGTLIERM